MTRTATVITDSLNLRRGPDTSFAVVGKLTQGATVQLTGRNGVWRRVQAAPGPGWVHGDFIAVTGQVPVSGEPDPPEPEVNADGNPVATDTSVPATYTVGGGDTLGKIAARFGVDWRAIASLNQLANPDILVPGQVLKIPGGTGQRADTQTTGTAPAGTLVLRNPFRTTPTAVTSSGTERPPHHAPFGGNLACDLDVIGIDSRGVPVFFEAEASGVEVQGVVDAIAPTCGSRVIAHGGWYVRLRLQKRAAGGTWQDCNAWVLYGHLDPTDVALGQVVAPGTQVGRLGPPPPSPEYRSTCASASHTHIEVTRGSWVEDKDAVITNAPIMRLAI
jgi:LysM repeat protein